MIKIVIHVLIWNGITAMFNHKGCDGIHLVREGNMTLCTVKSSFVLM